MSALCWPTWTHHLAEGLFDADRGSLWREVQQICSERRGAPLGTTGQPRNKDQVFGCDVRE
eukprot:3345768-Prorocentrum_lima.AAC.1